MAKTPKRKEDTPDVEAFLNSLLGGSVATGPTARAVTPKLTKTTRDLPGQQYDKVKKAAKLPPEGVETGGIPAELEALIAEATGGGGGQPTDMIAQVLAAIQGDGLPITPTMKATQPGPMQKPHPDNFSPNNQMQKLLEMIIGGGAAAERSETPYWDEPNG